MKTIETHRQAILTRYHCPTNTKGARISAQYAGGRKYYDYCHEFSLTENHAHACRMMALYLGWDINYTAGDPTEAKWYGGTIPSGDMVWVSVEES